MACTPRQSNSHHNLLTATIQTRSCRDVFSRRAERRQFAKLPGKRSGGRDHTASTWSSLIGLSVDEPTAVSGLSPTIPRGTRVLPHPPSLPTVRVVQFVMGFSPARNELPRLPRVRVGVRLKYRHPIAGTVTINAPYVVVHPCPAKLPTLDARYITPALNHHKLTYCCSGL